MDTPKITLVNGREITLSRPTMKTWRLVAEYDEIDKSEWGLAKLMTEHARMIAEMYGIESEDEIDPADVLPGYIAAATYVINIANEKLNKLPNVGAEKAKE